MAPHSDARPDRPRALVTGASGFTGQYVVEELERAGFEVHGLARHPGGQLPDERLKLVELVDREAIREAVADGGYDAVVHLAAIAFVAHGDADAIYRSNIVGTRNLLEALAGAGRSPRVVVLASSANIYGNATVESIHEEVAPAPANDYAVSKLAMELMASLWKDRLPIVIARPFNYTGIGQGESFLIPKIVSHFQRREARIELGNLKVWRDFSDVRDVARAYAELVRLAPVNETVNLCSGNAYSLDDILTMMIRISGHEIDVAVNPKFVRENEVVRLVGDRSKLERLTKLDHVTPIEETLEWMYRASAGHRMDTALS